MADVNTAAHQIPLPDNVERTARQTPIAGVVLPYTKTLGAQAVKLYKLIGKEIQDWQKLLLYDIMALNDDRLWVHTKFGYAVPRRNGKTEVVHIRELWGLVNGEHIMHTAHRTSTEHASWERLVDWVEKLGLPYHAIRTMGREIIILKETGGKIEYRTRTSKGGLGEGYDLLVIDEAQEYTDAQESALKYIVTDSKNPQTIFCGTPPTMSSAGTVFTNLRKKVFKGESPDTGWAEWSVEEMTSPKDKDAWYETNPSLGTVFTERSVIDEIGSDALDFNIQRLGLWVKFNLKSAITKTEWEALQVSTLPKLIGKLFVGIKYGRDAESVSLSLAVKTEDKIFVETIDCRPIREGDEWIINFISKIDYSRIIVDGIIGEELLEEEFKNAGIKRYVFATAKEVIAASAAFEKGIYDSTICHMPQNSLTQSVTNCEKRAIGTQGGFGYRSIRQGVEVTLLQSCALAYWLCESTKDKKAQKISY